MTAAPHVAVPRHGLWADKYKPRTTAQMCYPVCANKLKAWLENFEPAGAGDLKQSRAVLLSGPPGIGKTTTVYVVAAELGRTVIEYNASDFRSRKSLHQYVSTLTTNRAFAATAKSYTNVILLMDEVDGCDIGGVGEVIEMIKKTQMPIICTCNDRWHPKLRSLINHVEDLRFSRPPCNIVANYLCDRVLAREGITLSKELLQDIVKRSGSDIRNMLNNLQLWCLRRPHLGQRELAECALRSEKNGDAGLFDTAEYFLLQGSRGVRNSIKDMETCYYNADLIDMFVQENYLHFCPPDRDWMDAVADAAASISRSDSAQRMMYLEQNWSVSRAHVLFSSIAPVVYTRGKYQSFLEGQQAFFDRQRPVKFPSWLGNNSTSIKNKRLLRCVAVQAQKVSSGNQEDMVLDTIPLGWERPLVLPLAEKQKDGIPEVIRFMDEYGLMRDDREFVQSVSHFKRMRGASPNTSSDVATAVKSAFTREFNKTHRMDSVTKNAALLHGDKSTPGSGGSGYGDDDDDEDSPDKEDANVVKAARKAAPAPKKTKAPAGKKATAKRKRAEEQNNGAPAVTIP